MKRKGGELNRDCWSAIQGFCSSTGALAQVSKDTHESVPHPMTRIRDHAGSVTSLRWMLASGVAKDDVCRHIAEGGNLEVLKWAREAGCPWDVRTCWMAAKGGHLEVLKWAREQGCPWTEENGRKPD